MIMQGQPTFTVTPRAIGMIADISAQIERYAIRLEQQDALRLRKVNKIKTIHSSLAIEGNTLSESQVTDILDGKKVVASLREIQEVKNAIATYDIAHKLNPFSVDDMLKAHGVMMSALVEEAGVFRSCKVGVFAGKRALHIAPSPKRVPSLMSHLFAWLKKAEDHLLIRSCVFHYQFEFIHPFTDGNGRMGRLWQSLILGKLNPVFLHLPVESMVHDNQQQYYQAIHESTKHKDSGRFIDFMLNEILQSLSRKRTSPSGGVNGGVSGGVSGGVNGGVSGGVNGGVNGVLEYIQQNPGCRTNTIAASLEISIRTLQRHLNTLKGKEIEFRGAARNGGYYPIGTK